MSQTLAEPLTLAELGRQREAEKAAAQRAAMPKAKADKPKYIVLKHGNDAAVVNLMGKNITGRMQANIFTNHPESGAFLDSCHHHCGAWNTIRIDGDLVSVAMQKWYDGIGKPGSKKVRARVRRC